MKKHVDFFVNIYILLRCYPALLLKYGAMVWLLLDWSFESWVFSSGGDQIISQPLHIMSNIFDWKKHQVGQIKSKYGGEITHHSHFPTMRSSWIWHKVPLFG